MVDSVLNDIKQTFRSGNMISKIILVNVGLYIILNLINVFDFQSSTNPDSVFNVIRDALSLPSSLSQFIRQPWSILTHMILHIGFWHILWNMLLLYWFGRIVGDLLGDERILPLYIMSGIFGGLIFMLHDLYLPGGSGGAALAMGASAAVMAIIWTAAMVSPDYQMHLLILGAVKLKYIALGLLFLDLVGSAGNINQGGHFAHLGGAVFGMFYVWLLREGTDLTAPFYKKGSPYGRPPKKERTVKVEKTSRSKFKVVRNEAKTNNKGTLSQKPDQQKELDRILDKINASGYNSLSDEEKDFLYRASKK